MTKSPITLDLEPRLYFWCACGRTATEPWCDGSHRGSDLRPVPLDLCERARVTLCRCRRTATPPRCDGSHEKV